jgi:hypothetical protein
MIKDGLHEMYLDYEKVEFRNKVLTWINKTKNFGKTDKRKFKEKFLKNKIFIIIFL